MDFELTDEQRVLREVSRSMLATSCPPQLVRSLAESGQDVDDKLWHRGTELGWLGLAVPEEHDGAGQGLVELCLVAEELGRAVAPGPFAETALVALALTRSPSSGFGEIVTGLVEGRLRASWAGQGEVAAAEQGDALVLTGRATAVQAAATADWLLVTAEPVDPSAGRRLVLIETAQATVTPRRTLDETRRWYDVALDGVFAGPAQLVMADEAQVRWLQDAAAVLTAADALGAGGWLLDSTVEYVKMREQFDRPLGSFQSVKHKAADMLTTLKGATAATYYAAMALDARAPDATLATSVAKAFTTEGISTVASEALQAHGGIGFTWEHDLHLYLRRAKVDELVRGTPAEHFERIVSLLERRHQH
jgi:alkylation response protein AidB-like acyl-CoA dehydrogenase